MQFFLYNIWWSRSLCVSDKLVQINYVYILKVSASIFTVYAVDAIPTFFRDKQSPESAAICIRYNKSVSSPWLMNRLDFPRTAISSTNRFANWNIFSIAIFFIQNSRLSVCSFIPMQGVAIRFFLSTMTELFHHVVCQLLWMVCCVIHDTGLAECWAYWFLYRHYTTAGWLSAVSCCYCLFLFDLCSLFFGFWCFISMLPFKRKNLNILLYTKAVKKVVGDRKLA